jgi:hypothetical protein
MKKKLFLLGLACALPLAFNARAEQSGIGHYVSGQTADFSGLNPTAPGWYFLNYVVTYNNGTYDAPGGMIFGRNHALGVTVNYTAEVPTLIYAYPFDFFGGTLASGVSVPYTWVTVKAQGTVTGRRRSRTTTVEQSAQGVGDIEWMPIMTAWTNGDFSFNASFNFWTPNGSYDRTQLASVGLGYWTFEPMVAVSWLSSTIGTEATIFAAVDFNTKNESADYQSGNIFHADGTLAQHFPLAGGFGGAGATAFYLKQFTGDSGSGAVLGPFEAESYGVGPTISYVHSIGKSTLVVDASWLPQIHEENTTRGDYFWAKVTLVF